jgi:hypothetical protein
MRSKRHLALAWLAVAGAAAAGCGDVTPPLDELPLRDALRADPDVVATLPEDARQRLAARLEAARTRDASRESMAAAGAGDDQPGLLVARADDARARRSQDPLIVGVIDAGDVRAVSDDDTPGAPAPLPPLEDAAAAAPVTPLELRALQGPAAGPLRALLARSGAHRLRRVVGWPVGAVAVGDSAYVGAAWLAALAPVDASGADGGASGVPSATPAGAAPAASAPLLASPSPDAGSLAAQPAAAALPDAPAVGKDTPAPLYPDAGVQYPPPPPPPPPPPDPASGDACGAAADGCAGCASADSNDDACSDNSGGGDDSCNSGTDDASGDACSNQSDGSSDDSCSNQSDGSDSSCSSSGDGGDTNCQVSRGRKSKGDRGSNRLVSLFGPLAFLLPRRRR